MTEIKLKKSKAIKFNGGFLVQIYKYAFHFILINENGEFIRWSSIKEWEKNLKEAVEEFNITHNIQIDEMNQNIFTLWSGSFFEKEAEENKEVTVREIFSLAVGDSIFHKTTNGKRMAWWSKITLLEILDIDSRLVKQTFYRLDRKGRKTIDNVFYLVKRNGNVENLEYIPLKKQTNNILKI